MWKFHFPVLLTAYSDGVVPTHALAGFDHIVLLLYILNSTGYAFRSWDQVGLILE